MLFRKKDPTSEALEKEIDRVLEEMKTNDPHTAPYTATATNLEKLYKLRTADKQSGLKADTVVTVLANLLGIGMIIGFERANVLTSKALSLVIKPRA